MLTPAANGVKSPFQSEDTAACLILRCVLSQRAGKWKASYSKVDDSSAWASRRAARRRAFRRWRIGALASLALPLQASHSQSSRLTGSDGNASPAAGGRATEPEAATSLRSRRPAAEPRVAAPPRCDGLDRSRRGHRHGHVEDLPPDGGARSSTASTRSSEGDVVLANLEGTLSTGEQLQVRGRKPNCFAFQTPPSYGRWLSRAGFTSVNLANNHAFDFGETGLQQTVRALNRHDLKTPGGRDRSPCRVGAVRIALIGFASYPWAQSLLDLQGARRIVSRAAEQADLVVVTFHGGAEGSDKTHVPHGTEWFLGENRGNLRAFSRAVVDAGRGSRRRTRAARAAWHGVVQGPPDRLQPRQLRRLRRLLARGPLGDQRHAEGDAAGGRSLGRGASSRPRWSAGHPALDPAERAHGIVRKLSRQDFGARAVRVTPPAPATAWLGPGASPLWQRAALPTTVCRCVSKLPLPFDPVRLPWYFPPLESRSFAEAFPRQGGDDHR